MYQSHEVARFAVAGRNASLSGLLEKRLGRS
jgi:hypothetical protein